MISKGGFCCYRSNNYTVWASVGAPRLMYVFCACFLVMCVHQWLHVLSAGPTGPKRTDWAEKDCQEAWDRVCFAYSRYTLPLLFAHCPWWGKSAPAPARHVLSTQPNPSGLHHYTHVLPIRIWIFFYICKLKWNEEPDSGRDRDHPSWVSLGAGSDRTSLYMQNQWFGLDALWGSSSSVIFPQPFEENQAPPRNPAVPDTHTE